MIIAIGCDHAGFVLKSAVTDFLKDRAEVMDCGVFKEERADYPDLAADVAKAVSEGRADLGILMCGTGMGMAMAANKIKGIRAGVCHDPEAARLGKAHNNLNVLAMGGRVITPAQVAPILQAWLDTTFEGDRHLVRINKIAAAEASTLSADTGGNGRVVVFNHPLVRHKVSIIRD